MLATFRNFWRVGAAAFLVTPPFAELDRNLLVCKNPYLAMARAAQLFAAPPFLAPGVDDRALVGEGCALAEDVSIGPLAQLGRGCRVGRGTRIYGGTYVGCDVQIGEDCMIHPNVTILDGTRIGNRVVVQSGAVIGGDGFGFAPDEAGRHVKIPQSGIVQIDDDVEVGANTTVDRATFGKTWIKRGAKIDNLVMIAHNVVVRGGFDHHRPKSASPAVRAWGGMWCSPGRWVLRATWRSGTECVSGPNPESTVPS